MQFAVFTNGATLKSDILEQPGVIDFLHRMYGCLDRALRLMDGGMVPEMKLGLGNIARATSLHDLAMREAKSEFMDDEEFAYREDKQLRTVTTPWFQVRLNKLQKATRSVALNRAHRTSVWLQMALTDDLKPLDRYFLAYRVSEDWTTVDDWTGCRRAGYRAGAAPS